MAQPRYQLSQYIADLQQLLAKFGDMPVTLYQEELGEYISVHKPAVLPVAYHRISGTTYAYVTQNAALSTEGPSEKICLIDGYHDRIDDVIR